MVIVFHQFWNEVEKNRRFCPSYRIFQAWLVIVTSLLGANVQNRVAFDSCNHAECEESCCVSIDQVQQTQSDKNRIKEPKTETRSQNRKSIFIAKLMPISLM